MPRKPRYARPARLPGNRPSASRRGYGVAWRRFRAGYLARNPACADCGRVATQIDHVHALTRGGAKWDEGNMRPLCASCHSKKTVRDDGGLR